MTKHNKTFILLFCIFGILQIVSSQSLKEQFDAIYGLNPQLYNGYVYQGNYGPKVKDQPFLYQDFIKGDVVLEGKKYHDLLLNYDVFNQLLILKFNTPTGGEKTIELPFFKLTEFNIGEDHFVLKAQSDSSYQVYQLIGNKQNTFWLKHEKKLLLETVTQQYEYQFSRDYIGLYFAPNPKQLIELTKNKSLIKLFERDQQQKLKRWLRKNRFNIRKVTPEQLKLLAQYIDQL